MDLQKVASTGTAVAVLGTGAVVGGNYSIDQARGGPEKRAEAEATELRLIVREEIREAMLKAWPTTTGSIRGQQSPTQDYRQRVPNTK